MIGVIAIAPKAMAKYRLKAMIVAGLVVLAVGMGWLSLVRPHGNFWLDVLPAPLVAALGTSLAFIPSLGTAISSAPAKEGGLASGIVNTSYQIGSALGLAAMTALAASRGAGQLGDADQLTNGFSAAFLGAANIAPSTAIRSSCGGTSPTPYPARCSSPRTTERKNCECTQIEHRAPRGAEA